MNDTRMTALQPRDDSGGASYLVSSFELRAGLEVTLLSLSQVPTDTLRELQRLRRCWQQDSALPWLPLPA